MMTEDTFRIWELKLSVTQNEHAVHTEKVRQIACLYGMFSLLEK